MHCRAEGAPGSRQSRARTASPCRSNAHPIRNKIQRSHPISAHSVHSRPPPEKTPGYIIHRPSFFFLLGNVFVREGKEKERWNPGRRVRSRPRKRSTNRTRSTDFQCEGKGTGTPHPRSKGSVEGTNTRWRRRVVTHKPRSTPPPACAQAPVPGQSSRRPATRCVRKAATGIPRHQRRPCHRRPSPPTEQTTPVEDPRRQLDEGMRRGDSGRQKSIRFRSKRRSWSHCANEKKLVERRNFLDCTWKPLFAFYSLHK